MSAFGSVNGCGLVMMCAARQTLLLRNNAHNFNRMKAPEHD